MVELDDPPFQHKTHKRSCNVSNEIWGVRITQCIEVQT